MPRIRVGAGAGGRVEINVIDLVIRLALRVDVEQAGDLTLEQHALREKGDMFEMVYGRKVALRRAEKGEPHG